MRCKIHDHVIECSVEEFKQLIAVKKSSPAFKVKIVKKSRPQHHKHHQVTEKLDIKKAIKDGESNSQIAKRLGRKASGIRAFRYQLNAGKVKFK